MKFSDIKKIGNFTKKLHFSSSPDKKEESKILSLKPKVAVLEPKVKEEIKATQPVLLPKEEKLENLSLEQKLKQDAGRSIIAFVDELIHQAFLMRASDVHVDPEDKDLRVRFRVDGVLQDICNLPLTIHNEVVSRVKILAGMRTDEHQAAQDGRFRIPTKNEDVAIDVRVSVVPTYYGENIVLRLLGDSQEDFGLEALGFNQQARTKILNAITKPYGMILATGPTGSGKTTTLYTLVKMLNKPQTSIITIEDPIEYAVSGINQIQVNSRTGLNFVNGLRSILRQDPNIIMVGEIRDSEAAGIAVNTALTGHLVLSTLHTNDAATTLPRLLDMKIEPYLIASTVNIAIGQRLVRRICSECKIQRQPTDIELKSLSEALPQIGKATGLTFYEGKGCKACNKTGYKGRVGIHEVLSIDNPIREAILRKAPASEIRDIAIKHGMVTILEDGFNKAKEGVTTIEEILRMLYD